MHRRSKSNPKPLDYFESIIGNPKRKANCKQQVGDCTPEPHLHVVRNYLNSSPLRNRKMLIEARTYKTPLCEKNAGTKVVKTEILEFLDTQSKKAKVHTNQIINNCMKNIRKVQKIRFSNENDKYFSQKEKDEACEQYSAIQRHISIISKLKSRRKNYSLHSNHYELT